MLLLLLWLLGLLSPVMIKVYARRTWSFDICVAVSGFDELGKIEVKSTEITHFVLQTHL
jgi:hypothetical protein